MTATFVLLNILTDISVCIYFDRCDGQPAFRNLTRQYFHRILARDLKMERTNFSEYKAFITATMLWQILFSGQQQEQFGFQDFIFMNRFADGAWSAQILIRIIPNIAAGSMSYTPFERHLWLQFPPRVERLIPFNPNWNLQHLNVCMLPFMLYFTMPSAMWNHLKRIFEGRASNIPEVMKGTFAILASHCFWNSQFTGFHLSPRSSLLFFLYSFSYERSFAPEGDAKNRLIQYLADTPVVIGFRPHSQRFLDFMRHSFTHVFVRSHIDPIIHFKDYIWDSRDSLAMQEICSMAGFNIKAQIGELMLAANSLQQSNSHWYRDYHMFIPKTWKTSLDKFMGDYQEIPKSLVDSYYRAKL